MHQTSEKANGVFVCTVHINDNDNTRLFLEHFVRT